MTEQSTADLIAQWFCCGGTCYRHEDGCQKLKTIGQQNLVDGLIAVLTAGGLVVVPSAREPLAEGREHLTKSGTFQSDKYQCPAGKVPLSVNDSLAQDLLWEYARRHELDNKHGDSEFPRDLREALTNVGFVPGAARDEGRIEGAAVGADDLTEAERKGMERAAVIAAEYHHGACSPMEGIPRAIRAELGRLK